MAQTIGAIASLQPDRVRTRHWESADTDLQTVIDQLLWLGSELRQPDSAAEDHPHPRNCVLNLVVTFREEQRAAAVDRLLAALSPAHPMRAILLHLDPGTEGGTLGARITGQAHRLLNGFPVQREQVLLHVRGPAADHLASMVEPLLVPDIPTFLWWSRRSDLDKRALGEVMQIADALVVDSTQLDSPVEALLALAALTPASPAAPAAVDGRIGVKDLHWSRLRPWRDTFAQFFAPADRHRLLTRLLKLTCESAGTSPGSRVGAALLAGWAASALGWRFVRVGAAGQSATEAVAETGKGPRVEVTLRSVANDHVAEGELMNVQMAGQTEDGPFAMSVERDSGGGPHAHVTIALGADTIRQRLALPSVSEPDLLLHMLWTSRRDLVFESALAGASMLLESLR